MDEREKQTLMAYLTWSESEVGIIMLRDMETTYQRKSSFVAGDPFLSAFREGERKGYLNILDTIERAKELLRNPQPMEGGKDNG